MDWSSTESSENAPISIGVASDPGVVHDENEDAYGSFPADDGTERLFVVADGMGGHTRGGEASTTAVQVVKETYFADAEGTVPDRLRRAFHRANGAVYEATETGGKTGLMGTTATALVLFDEQAYIAHVGDSRAYRFRPNGSQQITRDHTLVQQLQRDGTITEEEARTHPRRGTLTRALGAEPTLEVDLIEVGATQPGDRFLLCTDGLEDLPEGVLREIVLNNAPQAACEQLVQRANEQGGYDNATALVVHRTSS